MRRPGCLPRAAALPCTAPAARSRVESDLEITTVGERERGCRHAERDRDTREAEKCKR